MNSTRKIDKIRDDLNKLIEDRLDNYFGDDVINDIKMHLKDDVRLLLWEYEMSEFIK